MKKPQKHVLDEVIEKLITESKKCETAEDYVNLTYDFSCNGININPLQIREEILTLMEVLQKNKPKIILEIGTANGGTLFLLCKIADPNAIILSIDLLEGKFGGEYYPQWKTSLYNSFASKTQKLHLIRSNSQDKKTLEIVKKILGKRKIDFLLIDADHLYNGVKSDFGMYSSLVADDGIIAFHDIVPGPKENVGGVPKFWKKIKTQYNSAEILDNEYKETCGIGILNTHNDKKFYKIMTEIIQAKDKRIEELIKKNNSIRSEIENTPIGFLLSSYNKRHDLQKSFPEVLQGNYSKLVDWGQKVLEGKFKEEKLTQKQLAKFSNWLKNYSEGQDRDNLRSEITNYQNNLKTITDRIIYHWACICSKSLTIPRPSHISSICKNINSFKPGVSVSSGLRP